MCTVYICIYAPCSVVYLQYVNWWIFDIHILLLVCGEMYTLPLIVHDIFIVVTEDLDLVLIFCRLSWQLIEPCQTVIYNVWPITDIWLFQWWNAGTYNDSWNCNTELCDTGNAHVLIFMWNSSFHRRWRTSKLFCIVLWQNSVKKRCCFFTLTVDIELHNTVCKTRDAALFMHSTDKKITQ